MSKPKTSPALLPEFQRTYEIHVPLTIDTCRQRLLTLDGQAIATWLPPADEYAVTTADTDTILTVTRRYHSYRAGWQTGTQAVVALHTAASGTMVLISATIEKKRLLLWLLVPFVLVLMSPVLMAFLRTNAAISLLIPLIIFIAWIANDIRMAFSVRNRLVRDVKQIFFTESSELMRGNL